MKEEIVFEFYTKYFQDTYKNLFDKFLDFEKERDFQDIQTENITYSKQLIQTIIFLKSFSKITTYSKDICNQEKLNSFLQKPFTLYFGNIDYERIHKSHQDYLSNCIQFLSSFTQESLHTEKEHFFQTHRNFIQKYIDCIPEYNQIQHSFFTQPIS